MKKIKTSNNDNNTEYKWTVSQLLQNAVKEHNIEDIRGSLWSCIAVDPTLSEIFKVSLDYIFQDSLDMKKNVIIDNVIPVVNIMAILFLRTFFNSS